MSSIENKFSHLTDLPLIPVMLMEAIHQINGKQDLTTLIDKIGQDPAMTIRVLRIANSPFYGMPREIGSLREAVVLLGFRRVRDILLSVCVSKTLPARHKDFNYNRFCHHSIAVAECSRRLADCTGISADFAFTTGLLHDIGQLIIVFLFPDKFSQIAKVSGRTLVETERSLLGFDHMEIGGQAAPLESSDNNSRRHKTT